MGKLINSSVYSLIKEEYSGRNISDAFIYLTKAVIKAREYRPFSVQDICDDFTKYCGFSIPYHPMTVIVGILKGQGCLWETFSSTFNPVRDKIEKDISDNAIEKEQIQLDRLIERYVIFSKSSAGIDITKTDAERIIDDFISANGTDLLRGVQEYSVIADSASLRSFYAFYSSLEKTDPSLEYINSLIVGRILTELFISGQDQSAGVTRSNATVYLDTSVVFALLGVDEIDHSNVYKDLVAATQKMGMKVKVFWHTFLEIITLVQGSEEWIGNPNYDPFCATASTRFFVSHNYTKDEVANYAATLEAKLKSYEIEIDDMPYPATSPRGVNSEQRYYDLIVERYKERSQFFDEELKQKTIDKDARSLYFVDHLNAGNRALYLRAVSHIFITRNNALASIAKDFVQQNTSEIPDCVNDIYWGTLIWLNNPQKLLSATRVRVAANAYAAFLPSTQLKRKLVESAETLVENETITTEEAYFLKSSILAQRLLMEMTKGDANYFTEKTPIDILAKIKDDAKRQGRLEEREIAQKEVYAMQKKYDALSVEMNQNKLHYEKALSELNKMVQDADKREKLRDIRELKQKYSEIIEALSTQETAKMLAEKKYKHTTAFVTALFLLLTAASIPITVWLFRYGNERGKDYLNVISIIINILLFCFTIAFHVLAGKPVDAQNLISKGLLRIKEKKYEKYGYDESKVKQLNIKLSLVKEKLISLQAHSLNEDFACV